jgi:hypothetical protein
MATILQEMMGGLGTMEFVNGAVSSKEYDFLVVNTAATLSVLTGEGGTDLLDLYNLSGASLASGIVIRGAKGQKITEVTVDSGSVIGYTNI